jgi:hypothetical protein
MLTTNMKTIISGLLSISLLSITSCSQKPAEPVATASTEISQDSLVAKGKYLVTIMGCNDCHSPKVFGPEGMRPNPDLLLSGHPADMPIGRIDTSLIGPWYLFGNNLTAFVGPWGISYSANITSDETGIGNWTEEQFRKAFTQGKYMGLDGGRTLLPPMPWQEFAHINDQDLKAIFAYLKSTKPVKNVPPGPAAPFAHM